MANSMKMITVGVLAAASPSSALGSGSGLDLLQTVQQRGAAGSKTIPLGEFRKFVSY